jgi:hypothetical protein
MNESKRAADDVTIINARIIELRGSGPRRSGMPSAHCGHCPQEPTERCMLTCLDEAKRQGWYIAELW